jgi:putative addiction module component (TIGR02574 family)
MVSYEEVLDLKPLDKIYLIDKLLLSLDLPSEEIDEIWVEESERRIEAYEDGKTKATDVYEVLSKYSR